MTQSTFSFAWLIWWIMAVFFLAATLLHLYPIVLCMAILIATLTGFLFIRGVLRWMGKQLHHGAPQGH